MISKEIFNSYQLQFTLVTAHGFHPNALFLPALQLELMLSRMQELLFTVILNQVPYMRAPI